MGDSLVISVILNKKDRTKLTKLDLAPGLAGTKSSATGKERIRRVMSVHNLLLKPPGGNGSSRIYDGRLIEDEPNKTWATDGKKFFTQKEGWCWCWCWFFGTIDHFNNEILAWHISENGDRFEAMHSVVEAVISVFGSFCANYCQGSSFAY